jgi:hypothetical protein
MRHIDRGLGDGRIHVHNGLVAHERAGEKLDAVQAHSEIIARQFRGFVGSGDLGEWHVTRHINRMTAHREHIARKQDAGTADLACVDAAAELQGVCRVGAEIPYGGEAPSRQHRLHMCFERCRGCVGGVSPCSLREMDVAVPEPGHDGLAGAIDDPRIPRDLNVAPAADRGDDAA